MLFNVFKVEVLKTHGGSLRLWISKGDLEIDKSVGLELEEEKKLKIFGSKKIKEFKNQALRKKKSFINFIKKSKIENKTVYAYGAAAKGISFLNFCGKEAKNLSGIFDKNKMKQNCYTPGLNIKILDPERIYKLKPDYLIILPWNIKEEIKEEFSFVKNWGGEFILFE